MNVLPLTDAPLETGAITVERFRCLCQQNGFNFDITWFWSGRNRHGRLRLLSTDGRVAFFRDYPRSSTRWCGDEGRLGLVRTGAPRHHALLDAVKFLEALTPLTRAHTGAPRSSPQ